ncbi:YgaP family membrane protein [Sphingobacterium hotanense]|uniref:DUF2892 domain-containing protein n=1 Tax=Sphingobacterium hotanense TaxID=649196 RepID=A0ABT7NI74_9SPHI|nr:DUF2892 domain-containing protein [Sphingobacterium hotanense]MDM1046899.1 DUF2892 domain-containing protein [Sphingobacterium hotanense]
MRQNIGNIDRGIRVIVAIVIAVLFFTERITGTISIVLMVFAGILILTSMMGFCPLYSLLGIKTYKKKNNNPLHGRMNDD